MGNVKKFIKKVNRDDYLIIFLALVFFGSRVFLSAIGFEIDMRFLHVAWQNVDTWLLQTNLLESIWYLHSQPPLYNLFIGIGLKLFPVHHAIAFQLFHHFLGFVLTLCLYLIIRKLTSNRLLSLGTALLFALSPSLILFEGLLFYDFPVLVMLVGIVYLFQKFVRTNKTSYLFAFFIAMALMVLTRRIYHLVWFLTLAGVVLWYYRHEWKRILLTMLVPLLLIVFWYGKNYHYFGSFDASSWTGMGFFKTATYILSDTERQELLDAGVVSDNIFHGKNPFEIEVDTTSTTAIDKKIVALPIVGDHKKRNGQINFNHYAYIDLSRELKDEFISLIKYRPSTYVRGMGITSFIYFAPASNYFAASENNNDVDENYQLIKKWDTLFNTVIYGQPLAWGGDPLKNTLAANMDIRPTQAWRLLSPGIFLIMLYALSLLYGARIIFQKNAMSIYTPEVYLTILFVVLNICYVTAVGILAEAGENQRHRFMVEPLNWIMLAVFIQFVILKRKPKK